jgi:hypothetical protein
MLVNSKKSIQKCALIGCLFFGSLALLSSKADAQKTNFSGNWTINFSKSQIGNVPFKPTNKLIIMQKENEINIQRLNDLKSTDSVNSVEILQFNGNPIEHMVSKTMKKSASLAWSKNETLLTETADFIGTQNGEDVQFRTVEVFELSSDGNSMTLKRTLQTMSDGELVKYGMIAVYDKQ